MIDAAKLRWYTIRRHLPVDGYTPQTMPPKSPGRLPAWHEDPASVRPMLATLTDRPAESLLHNDRWVYEPKYDGIRALVSVEPGHPTPRVRMWSRNGNEKTKQFPDLVRDLKLFGRHVKGPILLDGEIVALDAHGKPTTFGRIQPRLHVQNEREILALVASQPVAFVAFDVLRDGAEDVRGLPLSDRRIRLERIFGNEATSLVRHGDFAAGDGRHLYEQAQRLDWEGLVAKSAESRYESGRRSPAWLKIKLTKRQEFVVGGWTEPRQSRAFFGALLVGVYDPPARPGHAPPDDQQLVFVGQVGTGFTDAELARLWHLLKPLERKTCPFDRRIEDRARAHWTKMEPAHWVTPTLVAEVKYGEWTADGFLRHPVYLGLRDDKDARTIGRERAAPSSAPAAKLHSPRVHVSTAMPPKRRQPSRRTRATARPAISAADRRHLDGLVDELQRLEDARRDGALDLGDGHRLEVSNLSKVFWPSSGLTKGDLLRYYVRVSPWLLPAIADRPLVMKRFPDGVKGKSFYQHRPPDHPPEGVRVALVPERSADEEAIKPMFVGGSLFTLLYMTQLAAVSQDPWFSRVSTPQCMDYMALDLDPMPGVPFARVLDVARWVRDELEAMHVPSVAKTSGSSGLHIYIPMPEGITYELGQMFGRIVATIVASRHPDVATVERKVGTRGRTVYVDFLQNIQGKTLATAYSARASEFAGVSTPLTWEEVDEGVSPQDFTIVNAVERFGRVGDLWAALRDGPAADLHGALDKLAASMPQA
ncbi:MAG: DNA ligase D [Vicinamibacterales bacterium]